MVLQEVGFWCDARALRHSASAVTAASERSPLLAPLKHAASVSLSPEEEDDVMVRPDPTLLVDHRWYLTSGHFVKMLEWYLLEGACVESHELAYSFCRFRKCAEAARDPRCMGACTLTDGVFVWPEGYWHYIRFHHVKPPQRFLDHVAANYRRALLATKALSREFGDDVLFLWDAELKRPVPMPSGMQEWILANTTLHLPGQSKSQPPDERRPWDHVASRMPTCCESCTIS